MAIRKVTLVHGFWHGSWCWSLVAEQLARMGIQSVAVDLDGHGLKNKSPRSRWGRPFDPAAFATEPSPVAGVTVSSRVVELDSSHSPFLSRPAPLASAIAETCQ